MRRLFLPVLLFIAPLILSAQTPTRDWRPEDRTIIGDFSRISAIAASMDRVYIVAPSGVLIWNPQFQHWDGIADPPDPGILAGVFTGLSDPLDNSLWLAAPDRWIHYQPDAQLWDNGPAPEGVLGIAFDRNDPGSGLFLRSRAGWLQLPRGGTVPSPTSPPSQPITPPTISEAVRANPSLQANAASILTDNRLRSVRYTAVARSFDNRGWFLGTSGVGALYLPDGAALPQRLSFGLPSAHAGAVFRWPDGVWVATDRTTLTDASLTFVGSNLDQFRSYPGASAFGTPFTQVRELAGQGRAVWAATDLGVARVEPSDSSIQLIDDRRGLPDSRVFSIVSRNDR